jgi:predicted ester cyclase
MSAATLADVNRAIARRTREEVWSAGKLDIADQLYAAGSVMHTLDPVTPSFGEGPAGVKQLVGAYRTAFPDVQITVDDTVAEGDTVVVRWTARATHTGNLLNIAPTGKPIHVTGTDTIRLAGGKIQETWVNWDTLGLLQQIGASSL